MNISSAPAWVVGDLPEVHAIASEATLRRHAVDREDPKSYWKLEKGYISLDDQQSYYIQDFQRLY